LRQIKGDPGKANEANAALKISIFNMAEPKSIAHAQQVRGDNAKKISGFYQNVCF
jgi:hypothetical protein